MAFQTPQPTRMRRSSDRHASREQLDVIETGSTILPPPLFDEKTNDGNIGGVSDHSNGFIRSRRHHRTIPRHFTTAEPLITTATVEPSPPTTVAPAEQQQPSKLAPANAGNKKPTCQCPIQHVPMTYMGANHLNSTRNESSELFLSTLNRKHSSKSLVAKSTTFPNEATDAAQSAVARMFPRDTASGLINDTASANYQPSASSSTRQQPTLRRQKTPVKISTISKQIGNTESFVQQQQQQPSNDAVRRKHGQQPAPLSLMADPIKATENIAKDRKASPVNIISKNEIVSTPFPIQLIESIGKISTPDIPKHPMLPPKMSKVINGLQQQQSGSHNIYASAVRIPTISKATGDTAFIMATPTTSGHRASLPKSHGHSNYNIGRQQAHHQADVPARGDRSKSLPRNEDRVHGGGSSVHMPVIDKSTSSGKLNFTTSNFPMLANHYTLPKSSKTSLNSTLSDVVNKVPSIITIPSPQASPSTVAMQSSTISSSRIHISNAPKTLELDGKNGHLAQSQSKHHRKSANVSKFVDKTLPVCTTYKNCSNPKEHFLPNDTSLDDDYLSECENCKSAHGSRYYLDEPIEEQPQETMTLQRKMDDKEEEQQLYYRTSSTLPTNTKQKTT